MLIGIVGKPSAGKSTFFKAITLAEVAIAPYPFTTIKANEGVGFVKVQCVDKELGVKCNPREGYCMDGTRFVPVKLLDVAGLVPDAHEGKGLGLQFLDDLRTADVLIHIVDAAGATNEKGENCTPGTHDPAKDVIFLEHEIDMWVYGILAKGWEKSAKRLQMEHAPIVAALAKQLSGLNVTEAHVKEAMRVLQLGSDPTKWTDENLLALSKKIRVMTKPIIIAANKMDIPCAKANIERIQKEFPDKMIVPCSAECELALREAAKTGILKYVPGESHFEVIGSPNDAQKKGLELINKVVTAFGGTGVQGVLDAAVFKFLKYIAIFPGGISKLADQYGRVLPDCFLLQDGSTALDFAFKVHSDLGKNFIRAIDVRTKRTVGKDHVLKHRDIVEIIAGK